MDIWSKKKRSEVMSKIRSKDTKPELMLRKFLFSKGLRYRVNYKSLPGTPDIAFPKYKTVIFVNGCFWHGHTGCKVAHIPKSNTIFWKNKIERNKNRDKENMLKISRLGWNAIEVWECEIKEKNLHHLYEKVIGTFIHQEKSTNLKIKIYAQKDGKIVQVEEELWDDNH